MSAIVISHPLPFSMGRLEFVCKRSEGPWRILGFHEQLVFCICTNSPPLLLNHVPVAASISMATPLHHHLKLTRATPRTGKPLFWVTSPLRHTGYRGTPICVLREVWGLKFTFLCQTIPIPLYSTLLHDVGPQN